MPLGYMPGHACRVRIKVVGELRLAQPGGPAGPGAAAAAGAGPVGGGPGAGPGATATAPGPLAPFPAAPSQPSTISHPTLLAPHRFPTEPVLPGVGTVPPPSMGGLVPATLAFRQGEGLGDLLGEGVGMPGLPGLPTTVPGLHTVVLGLPAAALSSAAAAAGTVGSAGTDQPAGGALGPDVTPLLRDDRQVGLGEPFRLSSGDPWGGGLGSGVVIFGAPLLLSPSSVVDTPVNECTLYKSSIGTLW